LPEEAIYQLRNITYHYPTGEKALDDINLTVYKGERLVFLGANGCGKSTLLKLINGLIFPQQGSIFAFGEMINEERLSREEIAFAFRRKIGFVFQNSEAQLFNSNVWNEIAFGPIQMGLGREEVVRRVEEVIEMLELGPLKNRPPFKLSGGEKKKVALASVLSFNPDILLLDEPTNGLDPRTQRMLLNLIKQLNKAGKTIISATHNLDILSELSDRIIVFGEEHRLVAEGSSEEILSDRSLLIKVNLIDEEFHSHTHGDGHRHFHVHA
jgi:cobalt/nickel transport system ATP-binding protein